MSLRQAVSIELTEKQKGLLEKMYKGTHTELHFKDRSSIILSSYNGMSSL